MRSLPVLLLSMACAPPVDLGCEPVGEERMVVADDRPFVAHPDELLAYCGVVELEGSLVIVPEDPDDAWDGLAPLGALEVIDGALMVGVPLDAPASLPRLHTVGSLTLTHQAGDGPPELPALRVVTERLNVGGYTGTLALDRLESVRILHIDGELALPRLSELYTVRPSPTLVHLPEAPRLERITAGASFGGELEDLALLRNVKHIGGLELTTTRLTSLQDLASLEQIGPADTSGTAIATTNGLRMAGLELSDLRGLDALRAVHGSIEIMDNPGPTSLDGLDGITTWEPARSGASPTTLQVARNERLTDVSALSWLERIDLPRPCQVLVEFGDPELGEEGPAYEGVCD